MQQPNGYYVFPPVAYHSNTTPSNLSQSGGSFTNAQNTQFSDPRGSYVPSATPITAQYTQPRYVPLTSPPGSQPYSLGPQGDGSPFAIPNTPQFYTYAPNSLNGSSNTPPLRSSVGQQGFASPSNTLSPQYAAYGYPSSPSPESSQPPRLGYSAPDNPLHRRRIQRSNPIRQSKSISPYIPGNYAAPTHCDSVASQAAAMALNEPWGNAASSCPGATVEERMRTLKLNSALIGLAQSFKHDCNYGAPGAIQLIIEDKSSLLRPDQLDVGERFIKVYDHHRASGQQHPWTLQLESNLREITDIVEPDGRTHADIMDEASRGWHENKSAVMTGVPDISINKAHIGHWPGSTRQASRASLPRSSFTQQPSGGLSYQRNNSDTGGSVVQAQTRPITASEIKLIRALPEPSLQTDMENLLRGTLKGGQNQRLKLAETLRDMTTTGTKTNTGWIRNLQTIPNGIPDANVLAADLISQLTALQQRTEPGNLPGTSRTINSSNPSYGSQPKAGSFRHQ